jgi:antitoxin component YwqK of YwqJK toxin-antitoxin module
LDSLWIFYDEKGDTTEKINYLYGMKNGYSYSYKYFYETGAKHCVILSKELFLNDLKQSKSCYYYDDGKLHFIINYRDGKKHGTAREFDKSGNIISLIEYRNDFIVLTEKINRKDERGLKQGLWKEFYPNDKLKLEAGYLNDNLNGLYKAYDIKGKLIKNARYENGTLVDENLEDIDKIITKKSYYPGGKVKTAGGYRDTVPVGIHREYDEKGNVALAKVYDDFGALAGSGIIDDHGKYSGHWKEYYPAGELKSEGNFDNNKRSGEWIFYYKSGKTEQKGSYYKGKFEGYWRWYYENDSLKREELFYDGREEGLFVEYDESGKVVAKGNYLGGEKEGKWYYNLGDHIQEGEYKSGLKEGIWKYYFPGGKLKFEGNFIQGNEDGRHRWYYENGNIQEEQYWVMGSREKTWRTNDEKGMLLFAVTYKNNKEFKINGRLIDNDETKNNPEKQK